MVVVFVAVSVTNTLETCMNFLCVIASNAKKHKELHMQRYVRLRQRNSDSCRAVNC